MSMWYSGLPRCCGALVPRQPASEILFVPNGPHDWAIEAPILTGETACLSCGDAWLYSLKPSAEDMLAHAATARSLPGGGAPRPVSEQLELQW